MALFLTVHARYQDVQWGLFDKERLLISSSVESKRMNKQFIKLLDSMLKKRKLSLQDLSFIAVHQGPAPFTTLRVCLSTVNGIGFATGLPLVGINGLEALLDDYVGPTNEVTVALLNAFGNDVYYAISDPHTKSRALGYAPGEEFIQKLKDQYTQPITFLGNACPVYRSCIVNLFGSEAHIVPVEMVSLERVASNAYQKWKNKDLQDQVMPIYLKEYTVPTKKI